MLVFAWVEDKVIICDIERRGWCVPSGRVEPGEQSIEAVCREAREEAGILLAGTQYIGFYRIEDHNDIRYADCFAARVRKLQEIETPEESKGRRAVMFEELPSLYHNWSCLTEQVFLYSYEVMQRLDKVRGPCDPPEGQI